MNYEGLNFSVFTLSNEYYFDKNEINKTKNWKKSIRTCFKCRYDTESIEKKHCQGPSTDRILTHQISTTGKSPEIQDLWLIVHIYRWKHLTLYFISNWLIGLYLPLIFIEFEFLLHSLHTAKGIYELSATSYTIGGPEVGI